MSDPGQNELILQLNRSLILTLPFVRLLFVTPDASMVCLSFVCGLGVLRTWAPSFCRWCSGVSTGSVLILAAPSDGGSTVSSHPQRKSHHFTRSSSIRSTDVHVWSHPPLVSTGLGPVCFSRWTCFQFTSDCRHYSVNSVFSLSHWAAASGPRHPQSPGVNVRNPQVHNSPWTSTSQQWGHKKHTRPKTNPASDCD